MSSDAPPDPGQVLAELRRTVERLTGELRARTTERDEALARETAIGEVLQVINGSPGDLGSVFDAMLEKATKLAEASFGMLMIYDGDSFRTVALHNVPQAYAEYLRTPIRPGPRNGLGRLLSGDRVVHIADITADHAYAEGDPLRKATVELGGSRTHLLVPLLKDGRLLGTFVSYRQEVRPFTDEQIALLQNFAAQAVFAMENARLLNELRDRTSDLQESLEYQTATSDVLKAVSNSILDLQSILDTLVATAVRLCHADLASINIRDGEVYRVVSSFDYSPALSDYARNFPMTPGRETVTGRAALECQVVHVADVTADPEYNAPGWVTFGKVRTGLGVPLLRDGEPIGVIALFRRRVEPFAERQIELVRTFADQAVIAIENARLLDEIRRRQAELRVTFDNMGDGVAMFDAGLRLAAWNRNFQNMLDLPNAFLAGRPNIAEYFRYLAARGEYGSAEIEAELSRGIEDTGRELRFERVRPDGRVVEVRRNPVPGGGFVLIYSDVTERKRAEAEIRAARDTAETALRDLQAAQANLIHAEKMASLGQLTAGIAHEIKNPLNFVNNFAGLSAELLDDLKEMVAPATAALGDEGRDAADETIALLAGNLDKIAEHGRRADGIVTSMLLHSRGGAGDRQQVDLNALVGEALNLAYHGVRAQNHGFNVTLERDFDPSLAPIEVVPQDLTRVLLNLFANGFYAADRRRREAADGFQPLLAVATRGRGDAVEIRVRDNGTGVAPELRDKLFQPFFTTKPTGEGTGLGLSISWDIVTQGHGGTIAVDSEFGEFTEFTIRLPRSRHAAAAGRTA
jgi:signal transduction histidine kinase